MASKGGKGKDKPTAASTSTSPVRLPKLFTAADREQEARSTKLNELKLDTKWRDEMRKAKCASLQNAIYLLQTLHTRHLHHAQTQLQHISTDIEEAEEQHALTVASHFENIDRLIAIQQTRMEDMEKRFEARLATIEGDFEAERLKVQTQHSKEKAELLGVLLRVETRNTDSDTDVKHDFQNVREDVRNKDLEERHALKIQLESTIEEIWKQFQQALQNYNSSTEERRIQYESLMHRDKENSAVLEQQMKKLMKLQESISALRARLSSSTSGNSPRNALLKTTKETLSTHFQSLKHRLTSVREAEKRKLTLLAVHSGDTIGELKEHVAQAERIIKLAEINRQLETEEERVHPFYNESTAEENKEEIDALRARLAHLDPSEQIPEDGQIPDHQNAWLNVSNTELQALDQFYKRYNKAHLDALALESERAELRQENQRLQEMLKEYLDGISVNEVVLNNANTLMVVNGQSSAVPRAQRSGVPVLVEGAHHIANQRIR